MIAIANANGAFLRAIPGTVERVFGFHTLFGFISEEAAAQRTHNRKSHGLRNTRGQFLFRFKLDPKSSSTFDVAAVDGCTATAIDNGKWQLVSSMGTFLVAPSAALDTSGIALSENDDRSSRWLLIVAMLFFLFATALWMFAPTKHDEEIITAPEPVTVTVVPANSVRVPAPTLTTPHPEIAAKPKDDGGKRAVAQNLGFLGMLGKKELTKAVGGIPSNMQNVSPGAGIQGDKGTGGEMLVGIGQGVKRTTVGNTGLAGLGGVGGGKGPGGGAGGYGDTLVGSGTGAGVGQGNGRSLMSLPLSSDIELEGGLDKAVIQATIAKYLSQVRACYETGLRRKPGMAGQVSMNFEIGGTGRLNYSKVAKSSLGDAEVGDCIAARMMTWDFPKPVGGVNVKVNYPFLLRPVNG
jgi:hypothetical protein